MRRTGPPCCALTTAYRYHAPTSLPLPPRPKCQLHLWLPPTLTPLALRPSPLPPPPSPVQRGGPVPPGRQVRHARRTKLLRLVPNRQRIRHEPDGAAGLAPEPAARRLPVGALLQTGYCRGGGERCYCRGGGERCYCRGGGERCYCRGWGEWRWRWRWQRHGWWWWWSWRLAGWRRLPSCRRRRRRRRAATRRAHLHGSGDSAAAADRAVTGAAAAATAAAAGGLASAVAARCSGRSWRRPWLYAARAGGGRRRRWRR